jgi:hypothetical protein
VSAEPIFDRLDQFFDIEPTWMKWLANNRSLGLLGGRTFVIDASPCSSGDEF